MPELKAVLLRGGEKLMDGMIKSDNFLCHFPYFEA